MNCANTFGAFFAFLFLSPYGAELKQEPDSMFSSGEIQWIIIVLVVVAVVALYNYELRKQVKSRTKDLQTELTQKEKAETKLKRTLKEREVLLSEIHHRVKNNLAIISGLLEIELMNRGDEKTMNILSSSIMRIRSVAMIHENFYKTANFENIPFHAFLVELLAAIEQKYGSGKNVQLKKEIDEIHLNINMAIPTALVINELVTNAYKFAFPRKKKGVINVRLSYSGDVVTVSVSDNGIGMPENFDFEDPASIGFMLVNVLSQQLKAQSKVRKSPGAGFTFTYNINSTTKGSAATVFPSMNA